MSAACGRPVIVTHVLLWAGSDVALLRRAGTAVAAGMWAPPGGHVEAGETPRDAAARELQEELGVRLSVADLEPLAVMPFRSRGGGVNFLFAARLTDPVPLQVTTTKADAAAWFEPSRLPADGVPWLASALQQGDWYREF